MPSSDAPVTRLTLTAPADAPLTPSEVLSDFADATPRWTYLEGDSYHYAERKGRPALVLRHQRDDAPRLVDFAFASDPETGPALGLVLLDAPEADTPLPATERRALVDTFVSTLRDYLNAHPTATSLTIERAAPDA